VIREFEPTDAAAVAAALHEETPPHPLTTAGVLHWRDAQPERAQARMWVAEEEGRLVGWAETRIRWTTSVSDVGDLWAYVVPSERGRGLGAVLYEESERHLLGLGARVLESWTYTEPGENLLRSRGFHATGTEQVSILHPAEADLSSLEVLEEAKTAEGFRLVPLGEVRDRVEELHRVYAAASKDVPEYFREDDIRLEEPARIAANEMTGTLPEFRRRGLARLAKLATIRWASEHGIEAMQTGNSHENPGILALNLSLGYRLVLTETHFVRTI
jgi:GNAT superfamily N-acetyltransferase